MARQRHQSLHVVDRTQYIFSPLPWPLRSGQEAFGEGQRRCTGAVLQRAGVCPDLAAVCDLVDTRTAYLTDCTA